MATETSSVPPKNFRDSLTSQYGPLLDAKSLCKLLYFPSVAALNAARARGRIPFALAEIEGRRGFFARTEDVAMYLERVFQGSKDSQAVPSTASGLEGGGKMPES